MKIFSPASVGLFFEGYSTSDTLVRLIFMDGISPKVEMTK
jgi:hypothetical protein